MGRLARFMTWPGLVLALSTPCLARSGLRGFGRAREAGEAPPRIRQRASWQSVSQCHDIACSLVEGGVHPTIPFRAPSGRRVQSCP
jgi:hypothetical protein